MTIQPRRYQTFFQVILLVTSILVSVLPVSPEDINGISRARQLRQDLERVFTDAKFAGSSWSVEVYSLDRDEVLYEKDASSLLIPASNNKIITASVALLRLGPDYRFKTLLLTDGAVKNGILDGNLIVEGFGDPSITAETPEEKPLRIFRSWAEALKEKGIRKISGSILGDATAFKDSRLGEGWAWDDLTEGYAAPVSALQFNGNRLWLEIRSRERDGSLPIVRLEPLPLYLFVENELRVQTETAKADIRIERSRTEESVRVRGTVPVGRAVFLKEIAIEDPVRWYLSALKQTLEEESIDVQACAIRETPGVNSRPLQLLHEHQSPPLSEIIRPLLKDSLNLYAETLIRVLGMELRGNGTFKSGKDIVKETLAGMAVDAERYSYADGSGLSRLNLASADVLVRILRSMSQHPHFSSFFDALPIAGHDGTLEHRLKGTLAENNLRAKTGSLSRVSAISGYLKTVDGELLAFSFIANNFLTAKSEVDAAQDRALSMLARFSRAP